MIEINASLAIPEEEVVFIASRSGGPGGQNVNKVATKVTLLFDVPASASLDEEQRRRVLAALATRVSRDGVLRVSSQRHRTQGANRAAAVERFVELLRGALAEVVPRVSTVVPPRERRRRLVEKKRRGHLKQERAARVPTDE